MSDTTGKRLTPSRRTVAKGAAWAVPVVAVASAAPAMAGSLPPVHIDFTAGGCKIPGNSMKHGYDKGYVLWAKFVNGTSGTVSVRVDKMWVGGVLQCLVGIADPFSPCPMTALTCIQLAPGASKTYGVFSNASTDSSSTDIKIEFTWFESATCGSGTDHPEEQLAANVGGSPWAGDKGQGSCSFITGTTGVCTTPPEASCTT